MDSPETSRFKRLESLFKERGIEFNAEMKFQYWSDPTTKAIYTLILELFDERDAIRSNWDPWEDFS